MNTNILLRTADGYLSASKALLESRNQAVLFLQYYISPFAANTAFACELYLKYIYAKENNNLAVRTHRLLDIFDLISPEKREAIKEGYQQWKSICSFEDCLNKHNRTFEDFRYLYEKSNISIEPFSLYHLAAALHDVCYDMEEKDHVH